MKKLNIYALLLCAIFTLSIGIKAQQQSEPSPNPVDLMSKGNFRGAIELLDKNIADNKDLYSSYKLRGMLKRMTGDFAGAFDDYSKALELKSDDGELYEQRAMLRVFQRQDAALVLKDLDAAISYGRKVEKIYAMRGNIRMQTGDYDGAITDFETAIGLRPDYAGAYNGLATAYQIKRNNDKAIEVLENFISVLESSGVKTEKVKGEITASSSNPTPIVSNKDVMVTEGSVIIKGNSSAKMPTSLEEMEKETEKLEQTKNIAAAYGGLADLYFKKKEYKRALELCEAAFKIDPAEFSALETRGKIKMANGDFQGAISDFNSFIGLMSNVPPVYLERGIAYLLSGKQREAQKDFDKYLQLFPNGKTILDKRIAEARQKLPQ